MKTINLDHLAYSPLLTEAKEAMLKLLEEDAGNPLSRHNFGGQQLRGTQLRGTPYLIGDFDEESWYSELMARLVRVVAAGVPHHVTQRGNRRQRTFFLDED